MHWLLLCFSLLVNFQEFFLSKTNWTWIGYIDEAFVFLAYVLVPFALRRKQDRWIYLILLLPVASILYSLAFNLVVFSEARLFQVFAQSFINFKFFLYFAIFYSVWRSRECVGNQFSIIFIACFLASMVGYVWNAFYPEFFIFSDAAWHIERERIVGFQFKPNDLALFLSFSCLLLLFSSVNACFKYGCFVLLLILIYFSSSRTALGFALMAFVIYFIKSRNPALWISSLLVLIAGVGVFYNALLGSFIFSETLSNIGEFSRIEQSQYIRAIMIYHAITLSAEFFPVGVGAGGFGSAMSAGSPVYGYLGVASSYFFTELAGVYDSGLASVLGEYGFLGVVIYLFLLFKVFSALDLGKSFVIYLIFFMIVMLSLVQPVFSYQVNSVNILLLLFALKENSVRRQF